MDIENSVALVTGANRGLGCAFTQELLDRGARTVYAAARDPRTIDLTVTGGERLRPIRLDVTDPEQVAAAAQAAPDVTLLINNAGTSTLGPLMTGDLAAMRADLDVNLYGTLAMIRAFAPILAAGGGGAVVNVLSAMSWFGVPGGNGYHVAKAAQWAATNGARLELADQKTLVTGVYLGLADTDMAAGIPGDKLPPSVVAATALDGVERGDWEVLVDAWSTQIKAGLAGRPEDLYAALAQAL